MNRLMLALSFLLLAGLTACLPAATPPTPLPSNTLLPPTSTPTPTIVWFPPTPTFTPFPTQVVTPTVDMSPQYGPLLFTDDFTNPNLWTLGESPTGSAALSLKELTIAISEQGGYIFSIRQQPLLSNFYAEITANPTLCRGSDEYGLLLRFTASQDFYRFSLACDGQSRLDKYFAGKASSPQPPMMSGAIPPGSPSVSRLGVLAVGKEMRFYANDMYLFTVNDPSITSGSLGVFARSAGDNVVTVNFSDLKVYRASQ